MTANRYFFGIVGIFAFAAAVVAAGEWLADLTGLRWLLFPAGFFTVLVISYVFEPFFARAIRDGYGEPVKRSDFSWRSRFLGFAVFLALAAYVWWRGDTHQTAPFMLGVVLGLVARPMPRNPEVLADE